MTTTTFTAGPPTYNEAGVLIEGIDASSLNAAFAQCIGAPATAPAAGNLVGFASATGLVLEDSGLSIAAVEAAIALTPGSASVLPLILGTVSTIAALRASTATTLPRAQCYVEGYAASGDGGEGAFVYIASDTSSADNGGTIILDSTTPTARRFYRLNGGQQFSVKQFGATGNGSTDDTAAIVACFTAAIAAGRKVRVPAGTYLYSTLGTLAGSVTMEGDGPAKSIMTTSSATATAITISQAAGGWCSVKGITFTAQAQQTTGTLLAFAADGEIVDCAFSYYANAMILTGNVGLLRDLRFSFPTVTTGIGILINGYGGGIVCDNLLFYAAGASTQPAAGIKILSCGAFQLDNSDIIEQGIDLFIAPGNGQSADAVYCTNTFFDTATVGVAISPSGSGTVVRAKFVGCWTSSHTANGFSVENAGTGTVGSISLVDHHCILNGASGFEAGAVTTNAITDIQIIGGLFANNTNDGVFIGPNVTDFSIVGATCGSAAGLSGNGAYGIIVGSGSQNRYVINGNRCSGNTSGAINDGGAGPLKIITNNPGFNPVGPHNIGITASPFTWTNNFGYPVAAIVANGTVSNVQLNTIQIATATDVAVTVPQGQALTIIYSALPNLQVLGL